MAYSVFSNMYCTIRVSRMINGRVSEISVSEIKKTVFPTPLSLVHCSIALHSPTDPFQHPGPSRLSPYQLVSADLPAVS